MTIHEELAAINRQHNLQADYEKTLALLRALKACEVQLDQVTMLPDGWRLQGQPSEEPKAANPEVAKNGRLECLDRN